MKKFMKGCVIAAVIMLVLGICLAFVAGTVRGSAAITEVVERATGKRLHVNLGWGGWFPFGIYLDDDWSNDWEWKERTILKDEDWEYDDDWEHHDDWEHDYDWEHHDDWERDDDWEHHDDWDHDDDWEHHDDWEHGDDWEHHDDWEYELDDSDFYDDDYEVLKGGSATVYPDMNAEIKELDIDVGGCSFETRISDTGEFYVKTRGMDKVQAYEKKGVLHIKSLNTRVRLSSNYGKIILYVPEGQYFDEVEIDLGAGEMTFDDLEAGKVSMEVGAGVIQCKNIRASKLKASVGMGQIELKDMDIDELEAEIGMGELTGSGMINKSADLECSMGNLDLTLAGSARDYNYKLEAAAGHVDIGRDSFSGLATDRWVNNNASKTLDIECSMGNVSIRFTE